MPASRSVSLALLATGLVACGGGDDAAGDRDANDVDAAVDASIDAPVDADVTTLPKFSFFVTSLKVMRELSGSQLGFGGDLRFGETGPNAGLRGADKLCTTIAERSMPGSGAKGWVAFLSASNDGNGNQVHAIDRIGNGPWYDRLGRMLAPDRASLMFIRPQGGSAVIKNDFPNEDGVPNHDPDGTGDVDNHDFLTGTNLQGRLQLHRQTGRPQTCLDWTAKTGNVAVESQPRVGHSWPRGETGEINSWMSSLTETGCAPGVSIIEMGPPFPPDPNNFANNTVGTGGGYGGIYCFALIP
jgi:hypothetical protein